MFYVVGINKTLVMYCIRDSLAVNEHENEVVLQKKETRKKERELTEW